MSIMKVRDSQGREIGPNAMDTTRHMSVAELQALKARGINTVFRYIAGGGDWKQLNRQDVENYRAAGMNLALIFEGRGDQPSTFSAAQGHADARAAIARARALGLSPDAAIYFCVDYDASRGDINGRILPYFQAIRDELRAEGSNLKVGVYGSGAVCQAVHDGGLAERTWLAGSSGWSGTQEYWRSGKWDILQQIDGKTDYDVINPLTHGIGDYNPQRAYTEAMGPGASTVDPATASHNLQTWLDNTSTGDSDHDTTRDQFYRNAALFGMNQEQVRQMLQEGGPLAILLIFLMMLLVGPAKMNEIGASGQSQRPNEPPPPGTVFNPFGGSGENPGTPQSQGLQPDIARSLGVNSIDIQLDSNALGILSALAAQGVPVDLAGPNGVDGPDGKFDLNDIVAMGRRLTGANVVDHPEDHPADVLAHYQTQFGRPQQPSSPSPQ